ncbi:MAG: hypothetical protein LBR70_02870 [Lactobacillaceae bacterium]|jgi:hypothetical protein|nr:hypothetical protein [Lactobacillaceae bacterium]
MRNILFVAACAISLLSVMPANAQTAAEEMTRMPLSSEGKGVPAPNATENVKKNDESFLKRLNLSKDQLSAFERVNEKLEKSIADLDKEYNGKQYTDKKAAEEYDAKANEFAVKAKEEMFKYLNANQKNEFEKIQKGILDEVPVDKIAVVVETIEEFVPESKVIPAPREIGDDAEEVWEDGEELTEEVLEVIDVEMEETADMVVEEVIVIEEAVVDTTVGDDTETSKE